MQRLEEMELTCCNFKKHGRTFRWAETLTFQPWSPVQIHWLIRFPPSPSALLRVPGRPRVSCLLRASVRTLRSLSGDCLPCLPRHVSPRYPPVGRGDSIAVDRAAVAELITGNREEDPLQSPRAFASRARGRKPSPRSFVRRLAISDVQGGWRPRELPSVL